jgi:threonine dehydrogenase-like Zn-dependent dehydrogenase
MPREFVVTAPYTIEYREYDEPPLGPDQVRVRALVSGIKHGTEMSLYSGNTPFKDQVFDPELRMFVPGEGRGLYPCHLGSWLVGEVIETGNGTQFRPGDMVHGEMSHRPTNAVSEARLFPLKPGMKPELAVFTDPAIFALGAIHDAQVKVGDNVAVFGMGALGLIAIQIARLNGARRVFAVDRLENRLALAREFGADEAINAAEGDPALAIKRGTGHKGVDVAVDISGAYGALQSAIAAARWRAARRRQLFQRDRGRSTWAVASQPADAGGQHAACEMPIAARRCGPGAPGGPRCGWWSLARCRWSR